MDEAFDLIYDLHEIIETLIGDDDPRWWQAREIILDADRLRRQYDNDLSNKVPDYV